MIDTSCQSGRVEWGSTGRKEWVGVTPLGNKMLFAGLVKIMTHQMEHFKEIHTQLSWLSSLFILSLLCFPLALRLTVTLSFCLPWGISQGSQKAHRGTLIASTPVSANTQTDTHRRVHLHIQTYRSVATPANPLCESWPFHMSHVSHKYLLLCACFSMCLYVCLSPSI